jgi:hypothetical protein
MKPSHAAPSAPTGWHAARDFATELAFWGAFFALTSHYVRLIG